MPKEEGGQRSEAGASRGLRQAGGQRSGEGELDKRAAAADGEHERAGQDGGWATLLLSCLLLGLEICKVHKDVVVK